MTKNIDIVNRTTPAITSKIMRLKYRIITSFDNIRPVLYRI